MNFLKYVVGLWLLGCLFHAPAEAIVSTFSLVHEGSSSNAIWGICKGPAGLIACGENGTLLNSVDGTNWTRRNAQTSLWLLSATYGNGRYVVVGDAGVILNSADGLSWTQVGAGVTTQRLNQVVFGHGHFVAVGEVNTVLYSADGVSWSLEAISAPQSGSSVAQITPGWLRALATNSSWGTDDNHDSMFSPYGVTPISELWLTGGQNGQLFQSADGKNWSLPDPSATSSQFETLSFLGNFHFTGRLNYDAEVFEGAGINYPELSVGVKFDEQFNTPQTSAAFEGVGSVSVDRSATVAGTDFRASAVNDLALQNYDFAAVSDTTYVSAGENGIYNIKNFDATGMPSNLTAQLLPSRSINAAIFYNHHCFLVGANESIYQSNDLGATRLANISSRGFVSTGEKVMILGTIISGSESKRLLIRGLGPALSDFAVTNVLADPLIQVYDQKGTLLSQVAAWSKSSGAADVIAALAEMGSPAMQPDRADSALVLTLPPGGYTFVLRSASGQNGIALLEAYDLDGDSSGSKLINISTRAAVGPGEKTLIAGFIIHGNEAKRVLLRGIGPVLKNSGVTDPLSDPVLSVYQQSSKINGNDNWGSITTGDFVYGHNVSAAEMALLMKTAGVTSLDNSPNEAALVVKLSPGAYTIQLTGKNGTSGTALVEAYELTD